MWAKLFVVLGTAVAMTGVGMYIAMPENVFSLTSDEASASLPSASNRTCCGLKTVSSCSLATNDEPCLAEHETETVAPSQSPDAVSAANIGCNLCPASADALAACTGGLTLGLGKGKVTNFNCCAE
jgi:hypothetical protein